MPSLNHVHTLVKYKTRPGYMRCAAPYCTYVTDRESCHGKASICTTCGKEFILTYQDLKRVRPRCLECSNTKEGKKYREARALFESLVPRKEDENDKTASSEDFDQ